MKLDAARLDDLKVEGRRVLVRVDFNCPQDEAGAISDDTRVRAALPTIKELLARGATPVLMSHLGRPKGKVVESMRLEPMGARLQELLGSPVLRLKESTGPAVQQAIAAARAARRCSWRTCASTPAMKAATPRWRPSGPSSAIASSTTPSARRTATTRRCAAWRVFCRARRAA